MSQSGPTESLPARLLMKICSSRSCVEVDWTSGFYPRRSGGSKIGSAGWVGRRERPTKWPNICGSWAI